ncbi:hypothetical protein HOO54_21135 [Bacillus sp. WMMC1349]|uniref:ThiF family adenylyltransferase n=1 Tax=Bacillus sp. WMMC1349 TaxID=2736254 RepID=UPI00155390CA|nr:ThiF family adenylyltransferase [Bacillus sp. WMMC1349]NPC94659.1 hypothetical protein [Bacillus sp. WMMC1349]
MKYYLKKGMYWAKKDHEIFVYYTNNYLRKGIRSSDNDKLFNLLKILSNPKTYEELTRLSPFNTQKDLDDTLSYLSSKGYISTKEIEFDQIENRIRSFVDCIPHVSYNDYRAKMTEKHVCIIGTGTVGSYLPETLIKLGVNRFTLIDPDIVEEGNLFAQNYTCSDIGKYKVNVLKDRYEKHFNTCEMTSIVHSLTDYKDLRELVDLKEIDYLVLGADSATLIIDILEKIFLDFPHIKILISGYAVFQQHCCLIDKETYLSLLNSSKKILSTLNDLDEVIVENTGTIFDSLFSAMSMAKLIFDNLLGMNQSDLARADFFKNDYFIGDSTEYKIYEQNKKLQQLGES